MNYRFINLFIASIYKYLKEKIKQIYFSTSLYNKTLSVVPPTRSYDMNNIPLLQEIIDQDEKIINIIKEFSKNIWKLDNIGNNNIHKLNAFSWLPLFDVKKDKVLVKNLILEWLKKYENYNSNAWSLNLISKRIIFWICCSHFTVRSEDLVFRNRVINSIIKQSFHLNKNINLLSKPIDRVFALVSLVLTSITFEGYQKLFQVSLKNLNTEAKSMIDKNGFVLSKDPEEQFWLLHHLFIVKEFLIFSQNTSPEFIDNLIVSVGNNLLGLYYSNNEIPLFNGSKKLNIENFNKLLKLKNYNFEKKNITHSYLYTKIKKFELMMDANNPPPDFKSQNYQSGCLSFEFLYNGEKIITNCGSAKNFSDNLSIISQSTAAHSTITINDTSSCLSQQNKLIKKYFGNSLKRKLKVYKKDIMKSKHFATVSAGHNGYNSNYNCLYERKITINDLEHKLLGEELIIITKKSNKNINYALRFHVIPETKLLQTQGGDILLSLHNQGWKFQTNKSNLKIEKNLYFANYDKIIESQCIVIEGKLNESLNKIEWSLEKTNK